jgi:hypothetical protein
MLETAVGAPTPSCNPEKQVKKLSLRSGLLATTTICGAALSTMAGGALVATVATLLPTAVQAQDFTSGAIDGTVKTEAGTPAAGATVTLTGVSNGYTITATTDAVGHFSATQLPTGTYNVDIVAADGTKTEDTVMVSLGTTSNYDFVTKAPVAATEVVVRGKARRNLDFDRTTTGAVLDVQQLAARLPVGRSIEALADLVPGISVNDVFGPPSISGSSPAENIYYVNGMNVTNFRNFLGGTTIPFDFYDQVDVKTGGYSAEYGRSTGGAFVANTRSGSNQFHGGVSLYYTPDTMAADARIVASDLNSDDHNYTSGRTAFEQKEATVWLSGPIMKDHIYFFAFYNPRDFTTTSTNYRTDGGDPWRTIETTKDSPFYGGKLDFVLNPRHRLEYTYFVDDQTATSMYNNYEEGTQSGVFAGSGGLTRIVKYTGKFTDWFTLSAMYGRSSYNQTTSSDLDGEASVFDGGAVIRGNPALTVDSGQDLRENLRVDADFYFNLIGRHHLKIGADKEELNANALTQYSGGVYYRYYGAGTNCGSTGTITDNCVRVRKLFSGGSFNIENKAWYIQDSWDISDRLNLSIGLRNDTFTNYNANGEAFLNSEDQRAWRVGASYDVFGDKSTKLTAFYGRYYLPIAGNTNIRLAGAEDFTQDFYTYTSRDPDTLVPVLGTELSHEVLSNGVAPLPDTVVDHNLKPQYQDEYVLGLEHRFSNGWKGSVNLMYRELGAVMEDADLDQGEFACDYLIGKGEITTCGSFGGSGYVLINPGSDVTVTLGDSFDDAAGKVVTIPGDVLGFPQAERTYTALTFTLERPWDGKWFAAGSLALSRSYGNIEGGVKSDNGQDDTGLTQDFDEPGWMDGSTGLLPNHHGFSLKGQAAYQVTERILIGGTASLLSPRKYGCIGFYPLDDGRAVDTTATAWYCNGKLTPRGKSFDGDWINKIDVSASYEYPLAVGSVVFSAEIFNLLNSMGADQYDEFGEVGGVGTLSNTYGMPSSYQTPRTVRLGAKYKF